MSFQEAVTTCLSKYVGFSGRARRSEYWYFVVFNIILSIAASIPDAILNVSIFQYLITAALLLPGLAVSVRRLHDTGRSGLWILLALVPLVGAIILIVWMATDGFPGDNQYGPSPKASSAPQLA